MKSFPNPYLRGIICKWSLLLFIVLSVPLLLQIVSANEKPSKSVTATLVVTKFTTTFQSEIGEQFSSALPILFQEGLQGDKYNWLKVITDTSVFVRGNKFLLNGSILDYGNKFNINLKISLIDKVGKSNLLIIKNYQILSDSILVQVNRMSKELASIIQESISVSENNEGIHVWVDSFKSMVSDSSLNQVSDYLASSLISELHDLPNISAVEREDIRTHLPPKEEVFNNLSLIVSGTLQAVGNSITASALISDVSGVKNFYEVSTTVNAHDIVDIPRILVEKLKTFLKVYQEIYNKLVELQGTKDFFTQAEKYFNNSNDPNAKAKAEVMLNKALQLDPYCIPALVRLGELLKEKQNYDDAISIYKRALSIDPKLTDTYLGLGETYYYNSQDSLALWYFEEAITQATRSKNTKAISKGYRWLGVLNSQKKNYSLAINYFDRSLKINKDDSQTWYGIGNACFLRYSELFKKVSDTTDIYLAIEYFCESAKRFSNDSTSVRNQAYLLNYWAKVYYDAWNSEDTSLTKDYKASLEKMAKEKFLMSSQIESYDKELTAESLNYLAWFANKNLEIEAAKEYSRKAVILEPKGEWSYRLFAYIYGNDSTYRQEALQNIQKALYIKQSVASYTILGSIYLNDEKYDSAYMAYQKARNVEKNISFATIEGFYLSGMALKKYDEVKSALNEYRQQSISGNDSLWYFIQMAKLYREIKKFELSLDYTRKALDLDLKYKDAQALLDSLYYHDSYLPALDVMINILERISKEEGTSKAYNNLGWAYRAKQTYNKSLDAALMAIQTSQTKVDTADAYYLCAMIYYSQGLEASNAIDTAAVRNYMSTAIQYLEKASKLFPKWISPLATLQIIYHEFIIDYEKSYMFGINMLSIGSLPRDYILNTIEAMLSAKKFDESSHEAEKILVADSLLVAKKFDESSHEAEKIHITGSLGNSPLNPDERLAMVFILIASKVLNGDIFGGFSEFGGFKTDCLKPQPKRTWDWTGTTLFLKTYEHLDTRYRTILLDLISVLKSDKKNEMLNSLNSIEKNWKSLLK